MDLRDLEWLTVLAEHRHVTDTAAVLGTTQPTLSRALARLEADIGARLFERVPGGVVPTPVGEVVVEAARDLVRRRDRLRAEVAGLVDPETGVVRLAFLDSISTSLVPGLLRDFHAAAPRVRVELSQEPAHHMVDDLDAGRVDVAITSGPLPERAGWHPLQEERLVLVVPPRHRLAGRRRATLAEVAEDELVTTPPGFGFTTLVDALYREAGFAPRISFESQDLATIEGLVAAGLGVAVVPEPFVGLSGTVGLSLRAAGARRTVGLAWRGDRPLSAPAERFRRFVVERGA
ncbi:LysR family transcriptional regulator [Nocardioides litoris]|uniref:LysR family transcriptional regulator n=1 Tax=Nocardioides litoris TaxID=1926648 RepID=UPI001121FACA|nr:LysR family transcriptional regulator [Nocardioides litoris]